MTPTPREVPVREAPEWPHRDKPYWPLTRNDPNAGADGYIHRCRLDGEPWPCPSQQYLDGLVAAVRAKQDLICSCRNPNCPRLEAILAILEGARATDDEGQR